MSPDQFRHYKVNVPNVDDEHWDMITFMYGINAAAAQGDKNTVALKVGMLETMLEEHCIQEEQLMEKINFPYINAHKEAHNVLRRRMREIANNVNLEKFYLHKDLMRNLHDIFVTHIDHMDMQYADWIKQNNIKI